MSNETRLPVLRPVSQQSQPQTSSSQSSTFTLEQLAQVLSSHKEEMLKKVSETVSSQIKDFEENLLASNADLAQTVIQESAETFVFKKKSNKRQSDFNRKILHINEHALNLIFLASAFEQKNNERAQQELEEGRHLISKRQKVIKLADKSKFGWGTVNEYLMDELTSDDEDANKIKKAEQRAARKSKERLALQNKRKVTVTANQTHSNRYDFDSFRTSPKVPINSSGITTQIIEPAITSAIVVANQDTGQSSVRND